MSVAAIRIAGNVELVEYAVPADRVLPVSDRAYFANEDEERVAGIAWLEVALRPAVEPWPAP